MPLDWQNAIVLVAVVAAAAYLSRRAWLTVRAKRQSACGGCGGCAAESDAGGNDFVAVDDLREAK